MSDTSASTAVARPRVTAMAKLKELYKARHAGVAVTATSYAPKFRDDVYIIGQGTATPVNENYALWLPSALELAIILGDICVSGFMGPPCDLATGSPFVYSDNVPWLEFNNGAQRNAGQLAQYWKANSGDPGGKTAEMWAREDIAWG